MPRIFHCSSKIFAKTFARLRESSTPPEDTVTSENDDKTHGYRRRQPSTHHDCNNTLRPSHRSNSAHALAAYSIDANNGAIVKPSMTEGSTYNYSYYTPQCRTRGSSFSEKSNLPIFGVPQPCTFNNAAESTVSNANHNRSFPIDAREHAACHHQRTIVSVNATTDDHTRPAAQAQPPPSYESYSGGRRLTDSFHADYSGGGVPLSPLSRREEPRYYQQHNCHSTQPPEYLARNPQVFSSSQSEIAGQCLVDDNGFLNDHLRYQTPTPSGRGDAQSYTTPPITKIFVKASTPDAVNSGRWIAEGGRASGNVSIGTLRKQQQQRLCQREQKLLSRSFSSASECCLNNNNNNNKNFASSNTQIVTSTPVGKDNNNNNNCIVKVDERSQMFRRKSTIITSNAHSTLSSSFDNVADSDSVGPDGNGRGQPRRSTYFPLEQTQQPPPSTMGSPTLTTILDYGTLQLPATRKNHRQCNDDGGAVCGNNLNLVTVTSPTYNVSEKNWINQSCCSATPTTVADDAFLFNGSTTLKSASSRPTATRTTTNRSNQLHECESKHGETSNDRRSTVVASSRCNANNCFGKGPVINYSTVNSAGGESRSRSTSSSSSSSSYSSSSSVANHSSSKYRNSSSDMKSKSKTNLSSMFGVAQRTTAASKKSPSLEEEGGSFSHRPNGGGGCQNHSSSVQPISPPIAVDCHASTSAFPSSPLADERSVVLYGGVDAGCGFLPQTIAASNLLWSRQGQNYGIDAPNHSANGSHLIEASIRRSATMHELTEPIVALAKQLAAKEAELERLRAQLSRRASRADHRYASYEEALAAERRDAHAARQQASAVKARLRECEAECDALRAKKEEAENSLRTAATDFKQRLKVMEQDTIAERARDGERLIQLEASYRECVAEREAADAKRDASERLTSDHQREAAALRAEITRLRDALQRHISVVGSKNAESSADEEEEEEESALLEQLNGHHGEENGSNTEAVNRTRNTGAKKVDSTQKPRHSVRRFVASGEPRAESSTPDSSSGVSSMLHHHHQRKRNDDAALSASMSRTDARSSGAVTHQKRLAACQRRIDALLDVSRRVLNGGRPTKDDILGSFSDSDAEEFDEEDEMYDHAAQLATLQDRIDALHSLLLSVYAQNHQQLDARQPTPQRGAPGAGRHGESGTCKTQQADCRVQ